MMPKGVEHAIKNPILEEETRVKNPMMPKGVEHSTVYRTSWKRA